MLKRYVIAVVLVIVMAGSCLLSMQGKHNPTTKIKAEDVTKVSLSIKPDGDSFDLNEHDQKEILEVLQSMKLTNKFFSFKDTMPRYNITIKRGKNKFVIRDVFDQGLTVDEIYYTTSEENRNKLRNLEEKYIKEYLGNVED